MLTFRWYQKLGLRQSQKRKVEEDIMHFVREEVTIVDDIAIWI